MCDVSPYEPYAVHLVEQQECHIAYSASSAEDIKSGSLEGWHGLRAADGLDPLVDAVGEVTESLRTCCHPERAIRGILVVATSLPWATGSFRVLEGLWRCRDICCICSRTSWLINLTILPRVGSGLLSRHWGAQS